MTCCHVWSGRGESNSRNQFGSDAVLVPSDPARSRIMPLSWTFVSRSSQSVPGLGVSSRPVAPQQPPKRRAWASMEEIEYRCRPKSCAGSCRADPLPTSAWAARQRARSCRGDTSVLTGWQNRDLLPPTRSAGPVRTPLRSEKHQRTSQMKPCRGRLRDRPTLFNDGSCAYGV